MATAADDTDLRTYLPNWVGSFLCSAQHPDDAPFAEHRIAAVLFLDIAGFSETTERLAQLGARGAEELSNILNDCFASLTGVIDGHGGDIVAFAGDGILAAWEDEHIDRAAHRAAQCGLALREAMESWAQARQSDIGQRTLVEVGDIFYCKVGGFNGDWQYLVVGDPIHRLGAAYRQAGVGDVVLCEAARDALAAFSEVDALEAGFRLVGLTSSFDPRQHASRRDLPVSGLERLVLKVVQDRAQLGKGDWLGEFRNLSILKIALLDTRFDGELLLGLHHGILEIQRVSARLEGTVHQVLMDDKGVSVTIAFGLPPFAHEDDPVRAVETALAIRGNLGAIGISTSIGVASGRLFCGNYGGRLRRTYGVIGQAINFAAHLMEVANTNVICDIATARAVNQRIAFAVLPPLYLKGSIKPISVFSPVVTFEQSRPSSVATMVGRELERAKLRQCLEDLRSGQGKLVIIRGEAGIGKSRLLADLVATAESNGNLVLQGFATAINQSTPYFAWRNVLLQVLDLHSQAEPALVRSRILERLSGDATLTSWMPLLEAIVPLGLPETALTERITGAARAAGIEELVVRLLANAMRRPNVLVFDDVQWFDSASIALLSVVSRRLPQLFIATSERTGGHRGLARSPTVEIGSALEINLDAVSRDNLAELIRQRLHAIELPPALVEFVHHQTGGNPFYCEELVLALRDTGAVSVARGVCRLMEGWHSVSATALSSSLERAIVSRFDVLCPEDQLLLKVASTIGDSFSADTLERIYPEALPLSKIISVLDRLASQDFLRLHDRGPSPRYGFRHAITQEVIYNLLAFAQRRTLHGKIATAVEMLHSQRLEPFYAQLARHWERADEPAQSVKYLELAAQQALHNYANLDAIHYLNRMMKVSVDAGLVIENTRRAAWEAAFGDAHHELADYDRASACYARAMALLGQRLPRTAVERVRTLAHNATVQFLLRLRPPRSEVLEESERAKLQLAAHIYEHLSEEYFFLNDSLAVLNGTLASLNLAERGGAMSETITGYSALALGLGMSGLVGAARFYCSRAFRLAERCGGLPEIARVHLVAGVLAYGLGDWDDAEQRAEQAIAHYRRLGDRTRWQNSQTMSLFIDILRGDLERADRRLTELDATISSGSSTQVRAWSLSARLIMDAMRGRSESKHVTELRALAEAKQVRADRLLCLGAVAAAYLQRQEMSNAIEAAQLGLAVLRECRVVWGGYVYGAAGVAEVLLAQWERSARTGPVAPNTRADAELACALIQHLARTSPVCRPRSLLLRGRLLALSGRVRRAQRAFRRAAAAAAQLHMPHDQGLALYQMGKCSTSRDDPTRPANLAHAARIFDQLGASDDLERARCALGD